MNQILQKPQFIILRVFNLRGYELIVSLSETPSINPYQLLKINGIISDVVKRYGSSNRAQCSEIPAKSPSWRCSPQAGFTFSLIKCSVVNYILFRYRLSLNQKSQFSSINYVMF